MRLYQLNESKKQLQKQHQIIIKGQLVLRYGIFTNLMTALFPVKPKECRVALRKQFSPFIYRVTIKITLPLWKWMKPPLITTSSYQDLCNFQRCQSCGKGHHLAVKWSSQTGSSNLLQTLPDMFVCNSNSKEWLFFSSYSDFILSKTDIPLWDLHLSWLNFWPFGLTL